MPLTDEQIDRYSRQIILPEVGGIGQAKLLAARVELAGRGAVIEWAALYLVAAGVGDLDATCGADDAELTALNPSCRIGAGEERRGDAVLADPREAAALARAAAAWASGVPVVLARACGSRGEVAVLRPSDPASPCPRCAAPSADAPAPDESPAAAPFVATVAATETLKLLLAVGEPLRGRRLAYDARAQTVAEEPLPECPHRAKGAA